MKTKCSNQRKISKLLNSADPPGTVLKRMLKWINLTAQPCCVGLKPWIENREGERGRERKRKAPFTQPVRGGNVARVFHPATLYKTTNMELRSCCLKSQTVAEIFQPCFVQWQRPKNEAVILTAIYRICIEKRASPERQRGQYQLQSLGGRVPPGIRSEAASWSHKHSTITTEWCPAWRAVTLLTVAVV